MSKINKTSERFRVIREMLGLTQQQLADRLLLSRNYIAQIEMGGRAPSIRVLNAAEELAAGVGSVNILSTNAGAKSGDLKRGGRGASSVGENRGEYGTVAPRFPQDTRPPSTLADVQHYLQQLIDAAKASGNPNAWPVIHDRLKKRFPLEEWEEKSE